MNTGYAATFLFLLAFGLIAIVKVCFIPRSTLDSPAGILLMEFALVTVLLGGLIVTEIRQLAEWIRTREHSGHGLPLKEAAFIMVCLVISAVIWAGFILIGALGPNPAQVSPGAPH
jgi:hypothetical protein